ncbi:MAG: hypothetical protein EOQ64_17755 [Mesorhizobium sp.]|uniref:hypothetical protein n=1 Tax=Mesorhizobium sp. TaxID=1871066 RepID=UPI000FE7B4E5|nr:hypothetical protein [Mesorhizobium sp.]RWG55150.1 MAG: hypothetical protein EOQ64_17755 [Mesorhizobium sp.]RWH46817.1 MAG: hypothetical protein EOQ78_02100 [Mesorhizobium sp.]RWI25856.1 MAG: hypothetical protein EOQ94_09720 [Mesorhizobium sp.]
MARNLEIRAATGEGLSDEKRTELRRAANNLLALNKMEEAKHRQIFEEASEVCWPEVRGELGYRHMVHLADVFEGWAFDSRMSPGWTAKLAGWAGSMRTLAEEVGPDWDPPKPERGLSLIGFIGRNLMDE